jgi:hypothetical protein
LALRRVENGQASSEDPVDAQVCSSYLLGFNDGLVLQSVVTRQTAACTSYNWTADQLALTFQSWADRHPQRWQGPAGVGVYDALNDAGLCTPPGHPS